MFKKHVFLGGFRNKKTEREKKTGKTEIAVIIQALPSFKKTMKKNKRERKDNADRLKIHSIIPKGV